MTHLAPFIDVAGFTSNWSIRIDTLSTVMLVVVTGVSSLVHIYSIGYMAEDPHRARFFSYLSFFTFAMLALVTANDFIQMFFGWEGVGVASYLLIGFWFEKRSANDAAIKAFVVNRVGDFGFALGIMCCFWAYGSIEFDKVFAAAAAHPDLVFTLGSFSAPDDRGRLRAVVHRCDGQKRAILPAHLAAGRDGRPNAGLRADPRRDDGDRRRVHGLPLLLLFEMAHYASGVVTIVGAVTAFFAATVGLGAERH